MFVSIIIPTYKRSKDLEIALDSVCEQIILPNETIIIDQSQDDDTKILCMQKKYKKINMRYFGTDDQSGARARNQGIEKLDKKSDIVCFFDDDVKIYTDYIKEVISFFENNKDALGGTGNIINYKDYMKISFFDKIFNNSYIFSDFSFSKAIINDNSSLQIVTSLTGCSLFLQKKILDKGYLFPDWMNKYSYLEDLIFTKKISRDFPNTLYYVPGPKLIHYESKGGRMGSISIGKQYIIHRYLYFMLFSISNWKFVRWFLGFFLHHIRLFLIRKTKFPYFLFETIIYIVKNKKETINNPAMINDFIFGSK